jgi:hypothetical protein
MHKKNARKISCRQLFKTHTQREIAKTYISTCFIEQSDITKKTYPKRAKTESIIEDGCIRGSRIFIFVNNL